MSELRDLYQEVILDHNRQPRNFRCPEHANRQARGDNPLCGDKVTVYLTVEDGIVKDAAFQGRGCAISVASASLMTDLVKGKTEAEARELFKRFHELVTDQCGHDHADDAEDEPDMDKLAVLAGVREYPMRVKCATLSWHTLNAALNQPPAAAATEHKP
jgi:nitrogen fixation protein NifU and related proteins